MTNLIARFSCMRSIWSIKPLNLVTWNFDRLDYSPSFVNGDLIAFAWGDLGWTGARTRYFQ